MFGLDDYEVASVISFKVFGGTWVSEAGYLFDFLRRATFVGKVERKLPGLDYKM